MIAQCRKWRSVTKSEALMYGKKECFFMCGNVGRSCADACDGACGAKGNNSTGVMFQCNCDDESGSGGSDAD